MTKIAILGTAPSSMRLAPFNDPSWKIFACSPGTYPVLPRCDAFFELHRWEPGVVGKPETQKPWFSPEYILWMAQQKLVWMYEPVPHVPNSKALPVDYLVEKYGHFHFTSSIAWMLAMAIEEILEQRKIVKESARIAEAAGVRDFCAPEPDMIGLWGVDMAATEEYGYQRAGCQFFVQLAADLDIQIVLPPESDLMTPPPLYGIFESTPRAIKWTERKRELQSQTAQLESQINALSAQRHYINGAIDNMNYMMQNWMFDGPVRGVDFKRIFPNRANDADSQNLGTNGTNDAPVKGDVQTELSKRHFREYPDGHEVDRFKVD